MLMTWGVFAVALAVYVRTLAPGLPWGDAGELIAAAHGLGLPHPPGSPLYLLLAKLATLVPVGTVAVRVNCLSALAAAALVTVLYRLIRELLRGGVDGGQPPGFPRTFLADASAAGAALGFAATPTFWWYAVVTEVYTLQLLLAGLIIASSLRWLRTGEESSLRLAWLLAGLALAVHPNTVVVLPGLGYLSWAARRRGWSRRALLKTACLLLPGLALYLYVPIRALAEPAMNWGFPKTAGEILAYLTAAQYRYAEGPLDWASGAAFIGAALRHLAWPAREFTPLLLPLIALGAGVCWRWCRGGAIFTSLVAAGTYLAPLASAGFDASRDGPSYYLLLYAVMAIWLGVGLQWALARFVEAEEGRARQWAWRSAVAGILVLLAVPLVIGLPGYRAAEVQRTEVPERLARFLLDEVKPGSLLLAQDDDILFPLWYVQRVAGHRPDVTVLASPWLGLYPRQLSRRYPDLIIPQAAGAGRVEAFLLANAGRRPLYLVGATEGLGAAAARLAPRGVLFEWREGPPDRAAHRRAVRRFEEVVLAGGTAPLERGTALLVEHLYAGLLQDLARRGWREEALHVAARAAPLPGLSRPERAPTLITAQATNGGPTVGPAPPPTSPTVLAPAANASLAAGSPATFSWTAFGGAQTYLFEFTGPNLTFTNPRGTAPDPINGVAPRGGSFPVGATSFTVTISPAVPPGPYQFRIAALDAQGRFIGTFSDARNVIVAGPAITGAETITTVAGTGTSGFSGDGGTATSAQLNTPVGVTLDGSGNLFIADHSNHRIRKVAVGTGVITTVAGTGVQGFSGDGGPATSAQLSFPQDLAVDASGNLFIADALNHRIRKVAAGTGIITTVAGMGTAGFNGDNQAATSAQLNEPRGVALDTSENLFIGDQRNHRVRKVAAGTGIITTVAGTGVQGFSGDGGPATSAQFNFSHSVALDASGNLFISDNANFRVRKVAAGTGIITTVAGTGVQGFSGDGGPATSAQVNPLGVALDAAGNLFFADQFNHRIRKVAAGTGTITTVAGTGVLGFSGDGGPATSAQLNVPDDVAIDASGNLFIADRFNHRIRKVTAGASIPPTPTPSPGPPPPAAPTPTLPPPPPSVPTPTPPPPAPDGEGGN
jgi:hypothetical protein